MRRNSKDEKETAYEHSARRECARVGAVALLVLASVVIAYHAAPLLEAAIATRYSS